MGDPLKVLGLNIESLKLASNIIFLLIQFYYQVQRDIYRILLRNFEKGSGAQSH